MSGMIKSGPNKATPWTASGWPRRVRDWKGLKVVTRRTMTSGVMEIPEGMKATVGTTTTSRSIRIQAEPCEACGVRIYMTGIHWRDLQVVGS